MLILVGNLWPRKVFYRDIAKMSEKLRGYLHDPIIAALNRIVPLSDMEIEASEAQGDFSPDQASADLLRQYLFFSMIVRALLIKHSNSVKGVVGYCAGIIPMLYGLGGIGAEEVNPSNFPFSLMSSLSEQDKLVARNVTELDVVTVTVDFAGTGWDEGHIEVLLTQFAKGAVYVTDRRANAVVSLSGYRRELKSLLNVLKERAGSDVHFSRVKTHGGLHTPLAAPGSGHVVDGDPKWEQIYSKVKGSALRVGASCGRWLHDQSSPAEFQSLVRDTLFKPVESGRMIQMIRSFDDDVLYVGLPAVIFEIFVGTGFRHRSDHVVDVQHI